MKRFGLVLVSLLIFLGGMISSALAAGILPTFNDVSPEEMPSIRKIVQRDPDTTEALEDGSSVVTFKGVSEDEYESFSAYLSEFGCTLADYSMDGTVLTASLEKNGHTFTFSYDYADGTAVLSYPSDTKEESIDVTAQHEAAVASYQPGDYVIMGTYPQGENGEVEPIEWLVLDVQDGNVLLISRYGLDAKPYNT